MNEIKSVRSMDNMRSIKILKLNIKSCYINCCTGELITHRTTSVPLPCELNSPKPKMMIDLNTKFELHMEKHSESIINGITLLISDTIVDIQHHYRFKAEIDDLDIYTLHKDSINKLNVPNKILSGIAKYFTGRPDLSEKIFACFYFALSVSGIYYKKFNHFKQDYFEVSRESLLPGNIIATGSKDISKTRDHHSIYLGNDMFLSKLGDGGILVATNLEETIKLYDSETFHLYSPYTGPLFVRQDGF